MGDLDFAKEQHQRARRSPFHGRDKCAIGAKTEPTFEIAVLSINDYRCR